ncbi:Uncharacterised protein [Mannheimia haemolytica]|uniref:Uncharacterized protein n=1 Tax=Mannheimia haemolytica TaxID=75985 RepID=A0A3S4Z844_MANHA|nr:Uncharacterised protein [Mannheimia haemolytica]VEI77628.1 Uncharacterised protein [Mannheimia haemolytica]
MEGNLGLTAGLAIIALFMLGCLYMVNKISKNQ